MLSGNTSEAGDSCGGPDESFLFLLTSALTPESDCPGPGPTAVFKPALSGYQNISGTKAVHRINFQSRHGAGLEIYVFLICAGTKTPILSRLG